MSGEKAIVRSWPVFIIVSISFGVQVVIFLMIWGQIPTEMNQTLGKVGEKIQQVVKEMETRGPSAVCSKVKIIKDGVGHTRDGQEVFRYTFRNENDLELQILTYGGIISSIKVPDKDGKFVDVVLGYDSLLEYEENHNYFGAIIGRVANRIANATFTLDGKTYKLNANNGNHALHGGPNGWDTVVWKDYLESDHVRLTYTSPDGDENYPGDVEVIATFQLTDDNQVIINYTATTRGKGTPINLTHHPYFNLAGEGSGAVYNHEFVINADRYTPTNEELIPTGKMPEVTDTPFDLRRPTKLGDVVDKINSNITNGPGFDTNFCINGPTGKRYAARIRDPLSHRVMEIYTNQPGLQFYVGNHLNVSDAKNGHMYQKHSGFAMETQNYPDAINQPNFPDSVLRPGSIYRHQIWLRFSTSAV